MIVKTHKGNYKGKILKFALILSLIITLTGVYEEVAYARGYKELNYSSKKVAKVTKVKKTYEILGWFDGFAMSYKNVDTNTEITKYNSYEKWDMQYHLVTNKKIDTMKKLKKYLGKYMAPKVIKKLLKRKNFIEVNGKLYYGSGDRGADVTYVTSKYKIIKQSKKKRTIRVVSTYWENAELYPKEISKKKELYKQKKIKGKWVFTKISLPY